jgi:hypothetical protein
LVDWEVVAGFSGATILLCAVLASIVISMRRSKAQRDGPLEVEVSRAGLVFHSIQVIALLAGFFLYAVIPETPFDWAQVLFCLLYFPGVLILSKLAAGTLEKRGISFGESPKAGASPNKSRERARE